MKSLLFKSVVVALLVFFIGNYLIYLKTGQVPLSDMREHMGTDWSVDLRELFSLGQLAADAKEAMGTVSDRYSEPEPVVPTKVYKWTDANGQVHFSDAPIVRGAEHIEVDTRKAISAPEGTSRNVEQLIAPKVTTQESALDKARAAAEAMKQRVQQQEQAAQ